MLNDDAHFERLESALGELDEAERAGVFASTQVDVRELLCTERAKPALYTLWDHRWASIAAVLLVAVTVWGLMFAGQLRQIRSRGIPTGAVILASASPCNGTFSGCVTGPTRTPASPCGGFDYDRDGDVDLFDIRTYQLNCEGVQQ